MKPNILVIGDLIIDKYLWGSSDRISPEAPVPVVNIHNASKVLGGAGNVVNNLKTLGSKVDIISVIGDCETSIELKNLLINLHVETKYLIPQKNRISSKKTRIISSQQQVLRYDSESTTDINTESERKIIEIVSQIIKDYDLVLISDYQKGVLTKHLTQSIIKIAKKNYVKVIIDPKGSDYLKYKGAFTITPNKAEASDATSINIVDNLSLSKAIKKLKSLCQLDVSIITLSENGIAIFDDHMRMHPTSVKEVFDVTGAGDTVLASIGFAIACGHDIDKAVKFSNLAAGVVVGKIGSSTASLKEIFEYDSSLNIHPSESKLKSIDEVVALTNDLRLKSKKIVFTNGCFDILHTGHINYLETAKSYGDVLIVGLNSDNSVKRIKGNERPIYPQKDRALILASLESVDYVVIFEDDTPYELIKILRPNILVKGGDYAGQDVAGKELVDELKLVKFIEGRSSSKTIEKIKNI